jgi:membrane-associated phospholipid phosphatase
MSRDWAVAGRPSAAASWRLARHGPPAQWSCPPAGCATMFALLAVIAAQPPGRWRDRLDAYITRAVADARVSAAVRAARAVSALAEPCPAAIALAAASAIAARRAGRKAGCGSLLAVWAGMTARRKLSGLVARPRPPAVLWLAEPEGFSLPSKHTALAGLTAGACVAGLGASRSTSQAAALVAAAGVGASRVCLGVHWPSDVLTGWLFAAGWLDLCRWVQDLARMPGPVPASDHLSAVRRSSG